VYSYNKGEWAEFYTKLKLLLDGSLPIGDRNLEATNQSIQVLEVLLRNKSGYCWYRFNRCTESVHIVSGGNAIRSVELNPSIIEDFFRGIECGKGSSFNIELIEPAISKLMLDGIKTDSGTKADVETQSVFPGESSPRQRGYSIKSRVGASNSLLNASQSTNFVFKVTGFTGEIDDVNRISPRSGKIMKRIKHILDSGGNLSFVGTQNQQFNQNLRKIDSALPEMLADLLLTYFKTSGDSGLEATIEKTSFEDRPYDRTLVEHNVKRLAWHSALGLVPREPWEKNTVTGGCVVVDVDGKLLGYTLYEESDLSEILFRYSKFDTASSSRNKFGMLYEEGGDLYFKLNLLIRIF